MKQNTILYLQQKLQKINIIFNYRNNTLSTEIKLPLQKKQQNISWKDINCDYRVNILNLINIACEKCFGKTVEIANFDIINIPGHNTIYFIVCEVLALEQLNENIVWENKSIINSIFEKLELQQTIQTIANPSFVNICNLETRELIQFDVTVPDNVKEFIKTYYPHSYNFHICMNNLFIYILKASQGTA